MFWVLLLFLRIELPFCLQEPYLVRVKCVQSEQDDYFVVTRCCVIVENPDLNVRLIGLCLLQTLSLDNVTYRVIQRDDSQMYFCNHY